MLYTILYSTQLLSYCLVHACTPTVALACLMKSSMSKISQTCHLKTLPQLVWVVCLLCSVSTYPNLHRMLYLPMWFLSAVLSAPARKLDIGIKHSTSCRGWGTLQYLYGFVLAQWMGYWHQYNNTDFIWHKFKHGFDLESFSFGKLLLPNDIKGVCMHVFFGFCMLVLCQD